uniref:Integrase catalytic domain-containing protein n=2 Tax=Loa loa TaxID=7209 RepID=A0A1I7VXR2_LOALO
MKNVIIADIEKAFLQLELHPSDRNCTRFLWLKDIQGEITKENLACYRFQRVPFGISATLNYHFETYGSATALEIKKNLYVDNVILPVNGTQEAFKIYKEMKGIFKNASVNIREFFSNDNDFNKFIPENDRAEVKDVPHCVIDPDRLQQLEIHVFTDAAPVAYTAAVYAKQGTNTFLIFAKSRIAPVKGITIPKLELLAILIGVRATKFIVKQLEIEDVRVTLWSDSQCALQWIRNRSRLLPKFIQNRIDEIRMSKISYRYIPSRFNPADIATKGYMSPTQLANFEQWWTGPQWLKDDESTWPQWENNIYHEHEEHETKICIATAITKTVSIRSFRLVDATRISKWTKLKRTAAWALRFIRYMSKEGRFRWLKEVPEETELTSYELAEATKILIMQAQSEGLNEKEINKWNLYYSDTHSLWKCRSRLDNTSTGIYPDSLNLIYLLRHNPIIHSLNSSNPSSPECRESREN